MKTNHKYTYSVGSALTLVLPYVNPGSLAVVLFISLALLSTVRGNATGMTKPARPQTGEFRQGRSRSLFSDSQFNGRTIVDLDH